MKSFLNILIFFAVFLHTLAVHSAEDAFFVNPGLVLVENWEGPFVLFALLYCSHYDKVLKLQGNNLFDLFL